LGTWFNGDVGVTCLADVGMMFGDPSFTSEIKLADETSDICTLSRVGKLIHVLVHEPIDECLEDEQDL